MFSSYREQSELLADIHIRPSWCSGYAVIFGIADGDPESCFLLERRGELGRYVSTVGRYAASLVDSLLSLTQHDRLRPSNLQDTCECTDSRSLPITSKCSLIKASSSST